MFYQPMTVEIEDAAAFIALAKDTRPHGKVIIFEKKGLGEYKFLTVHNGHLTGYQYNVQAPHPVLDPNGGVTHTLRLTSRPDMATPMNVLPILMDRLDVHGREASRLDALQKAWKKLLATSQQTTLKWTSRNPHIKNLKILVHNRKPGVGAFTINYTNDHVRTTTSTLIKDGFKVVAGAIRHA